MTSKSRRRPLYAALLALPLVAAVAGAAVAQTAGAPADPAAPGAGAGGLETMMTEGKSIYRENCESCHALSGRGDIGPTLVGNGRLKNAALVQKQIAQGGSEMPGFASVLSDEEILAVGTFVRNNWGNDYGPLTAATN